MKKLNDIILDISCNTYKNINNLLTANIGQTKDLAALYWLAYGIYYNMMVNASMNVPESLTEFYLRHAGVTAILVFGGYFGGIQAEKDEKISLENKIKEP